MTVQSKFLPIALSTSKNQINKIGENFKRYPDDPQAIMPLNDLMLEYSSISRELLMFIKSQLEAFPGTLNGLSVTDRVKTRDTLRAKMIKTNLTLSNVQDVVGLRVEGDFTTSTQYELAQFILKIFSPQTSELKNYLEEGGASGYRAIHVWLNLGVKVEIQIRSILQGKWANLYEVAADVIGREIRYNNLPNDPAESEIVEALQRLSLDNVKRVEQAEENIRSKKSRVSELRTKSGSVRTSQKFLKDLELLSREITQEDLMLRKVKSQMLVHFDELENMFIQIRDGR
jgi:ppGpp synthetase/RelA/SpoT-type nucleotidyltranferase